MKTNLNVTIETPEQANAFITELFNNGEMFNFDDDPKDILWPFYTTTPEEIEQLRIVIGQLFSIPDYDPFEIACKLSHLQLLEENKKKQRISTLNLKNTALYKYLKMCVLLKEVPNLHYTELIRNCDENKTLRHIIGLIDGTTDEFNSCKHLTTERSKLLKLVRWTIKEAENNIVTVEDAESILNEFNSNAG